MTRLLEPRHEERGVAECSAPRVAEAFPRVSRAGQRNRQTDGKSPGCASCLCRANREAPSRVVVVRGTIAALRAIEEG